MKRASIIIFILGILSLLCALWALMVGVQKHDTQSTFGSFVFFLVGIVLVCIGWPRDDDTSKEPILQHVRKNFKKINPEFKNIPLYSGKGAYTDNKSEITLCLSDPSTKKEYDSNTVMYVALHELAHVISKEIGHGEEFRKNFTQLLLEGERLGFYDPSKPMTTTYCGMKGE